MKIKNRHLAAFAATVTSLAMTVRPANAQGYHLNNGYTTQQGAYVEPHYQTNPNSTIQDNWSTRGNANPFTGQPGMVNPQPGGMYAPARRSSPY